MAFGQCRRLVSVAVVTSSLFVGVWVHAAGASTRAATSTDQAYSDEDCEIIETIEVDSSDGSGYFGATARKASEAFADAAEDIEDEALKGAMITLSRIWGKAGKSRTAIGAARALGKAGKPYGKALEVYTKALVTCSTQDRTSSDDDDTTSSNDDE
jgi:hypothetical protein